MNETRDIEDDAAHRQFVLTWVQPGLAGLMDGSVSTLAPIFAAALGVGAATGGWRDRAPDGARAPYRTTTPENRSGRERPEKGVQPRSERR